MANPTKILPYNNTKHHKPDPKTQIAIIHPKPQSQKTQITSPTIQAEIAKSPNSPKPKKPVLDNQTTPKRQTAWNRLTRKSPTKPETPIQPKHTNTTNLQLSTHPVPTLKTKLIKPSNPTQTISNQRKPLNQPQNTTFNPENSKFRQPTKHTTYKPKKIPNPRNTIKQLNKNTIKLKPNSNLKDKQVPTLNQYY